MDIYSDLFLNSITLLPEVSDRYVNPSQKQ